MPPIVPRDLAISYGGFTVGGASDTEIDGYTHVERSFTTAYCEFSFIVFGTTDALFAAACGSVEAAFRKPRQNLVVTQGAETLLSLSQTGNTGLDGAPVITKQEDLVDTGRSRRYTVRVDFGQPADNIGTSGRREAYIKLSFNGARRLQVEFTGTYTATPSPLKTAFENYNDNITAFITSQLSVFAPGLTMERIEEPEVEVFETNKTLTFTQLWQELILEDAGKSFPGPLDDPELVNQVFKITRERIGIEDTVDTSTPDTAGSPLTPNTQLSAPGVNGTSSSGSATVVEEPGGGGGTPTSSVQQPVVKPLRMVATYEAWLVKTNVDLKSKWLNVIRGWIIQKARDTMTGVGGGGILALINENPEFDRSDQKFTATMEFVSLNSSQILSQIVTAEDADQDFGYVPVPAWTGNKFSRYVYTGFATRRRIITSTIRREGTQVVPYQGDLSFSGSVIPISRSIKNTKLKIGVEPLQYDVVDTEVNMIVEFYSPISGGASTPSQTTTPQPQRPNEATGGGGSPGTTQAINTPTSSASGSA